MGGFVRDMLLGRPNLDVDVVVEGDGVAFAQAFGGASRRSGQDAPAIRDGGARGRREFHVDVTSARTEYYVRPGALPTVERSSLRQDLFRRDFTINAMAACLEPACFGAIADPFGGLRDLECGVVRVLHGLSFIDDPTRVLRAVRFEERYGFTMDPGTEAQARRAVELDMLSEVSGARLREELLGILARGVAGERHSSGSTASGRCARCLPEGADAAELLGAVRARRGRRSASVGALLRAARLKGESRSSRRCRGP